MPANSDSSSLAKRSAERAFLKFPLHSKVELRAPDAPTQTCVLTEPEPPPGLQVCGENSDGRPSLGTVAALDPEGSPLSRSRDSASAPPRCRRESQIANRGTSSGNPLSK